jgi:hypothetical protein
MCGDLLQNGENRTYYSFISHSTKGFTICPEANGRVTQIKRKILSQLCCSDTSLQHLRGFTFVLLKITMVYLDVTRYYNTFKGVG